MRKLAALPFVFLACALPATVGAQAAAPSTVGGEIFVNSEIEDYLRLLQLHGKAPLYPWSIRTFSHDEVERLLPTDSLHPWAERYDLGADGARWSDGVHLVAPRARLYVNSRFPYGHNDGAVWQGRGATLAVEGGMAARWGPISLTVTPTAFVAQNADFPLRDNGEQGRRAFAHGNRPEAVDLPQRFGDGAYVRFDPGQSTLRADLGIVGLGVSTANQHWGPAVDNPLLLGNNAAGFPHAFVGSSRPLGIGIGRLHGRVVWGVLGQSDYAAQQGDSSRRFMSGLVTVFTPRGVDGLEIGFGRFFHTLWADFDSGDFLKPVQGFLKIGIGQAGPGFDQSDPDNQLASAFFRWTFPSSAFEVYGEYAREDHNADLRDAVLEPDHDAAFTLGFRKLWNASDVSWTSLRGEWMDAQQSHLAIGRVQAPYYIHTQARQGHTQVGQILGSPDGLGGRSAVLALDRYHRGGRWGVEYRHALRGEQNRVIHEGATWDVQHAVGADAVFFRRGLDLHVGTTGVYNQGRDFADDVFNLNVAVGATLRL